jgi:4'-phosphopantetheinyl transferase
MTYHLLGNTAALHLFSLDDESNHELALSVLDDLERSRYEGLKNRFAKHRFLNARFFLKTVLATTLHCAPTDLHFLYTDLGKPYLKDVPFFFNMSHAGTLIAIVTSQNDVGIDIEKCRPINNMQAIAKKVFLPQDLSDFLTNPTEELFFKLWVKKEAIVKTVGASVLSMTDYTDIAVNDISNLLPDTYVGAVGSSLIKR